MAANTDSILDSVKKVLGIDASDTAFDIDVTMHINSVFMTLNQLGVGPIDPFMIEDNTVLWSDFIGTATNIQAVKTYVYQKVRLIFDPPISTAALDALNKVIAEWEWRLNVAVDHPDTSTSTETTEFPIYFTGVQPTPSAVEDPTPQVTIYRTGS